MFSRILLVFFAVGFLAACNSNIGDQPPEPEVQEFNGTQCLSDLEPVLSDYFQGQAKPQDINAAWDCVIGAAEKFKRYVRGKDSDVYTPQELATFLEKNFLDPNRNQKITPELQLQFMKLKQLLIGGSVDKIPRAEIDVITAFMKDLKQISLDLAPHMKILAMNWSVSGISNLANDIQQFEKVNETLQVAARQLATLIEKNGQSYQLSDFVTLITEVQNFFGESWNFTGAIQRYMPVVKKVKKALAGGNEDIVSAQEWRRFSVLGSRGYIQYLRYYYFIQTAPQKGTGYRLSYLARTIEDILSVFQELVGEKPEGRITREELYELMKTIELVNSNFKMSEKLTLEVMKVKQLFFGGSVEALESTDFQNARLKVTRVKALIERFMPYYTIYGGEWDPSFYDRAEAERIFNEAKTVLESSLREAGSLFEGSYDLNDLSSLIRELENLYGIEIEASQSTALQEYLPMIIDVKNMVFGGKDSLVKKAQWSPVLSYSARAYSIYLYYQYFIKNQELRELPVLGSWGTLVDQGLDLTKELATAKPEGKFSQKDINKVAAHLIRLDLMPNSIRGDSFKLVLDLVLNRVLVEPKRRIKGYEPNALTPESLDVLRSEFYTWHETEMWLNKIGREVDNEGGISGRELSRRLRDGMEDKSTDRKAARAEGLAELAAAVSSPISMTFDSKSRLIITNGSAPRYKSKTLIQLNLQRTLVRTLMRAFVNDLSRIRNLSGASLNEIESAFRRVRPLMIDLGVLDEATKDFASARFREANMFTPHGNGDGYLSFAEMMDMSSLIWSGLRIHDLFKDELMKSCLKGRGPKRGQYYLEVDCALSVYHRRAKSHISSLPVFGGYTDLAPREMWNDYMLNIFKAAGHVPNKQGLILVSDIALAPHVLQYVEMIFARFDSDKNGLIETQESLQAFPNFKAVLYELAKDQIRNGTIKEQNLVDVFTFILRYGKPPETLAEKLHFVTSWRGQPKKWDVRTDRNKLSQILGYIADQMAAQKKPSFDYEKGP